MKSPYAVPALVLISAAAALAGCGGDSEPALPPALTTQQATQEYQSEARTLTLPAHASWPATPIAAKAPDGSGMIYEPGFGRQAADHDWYCSWARHTISSAPGRQRNKALSTLLTIRSRYYYTRALAADSKPAFDRVLDSASLGDMSALQTDVELNCATSTS